MPKPADEERPEECGSCSFPTKALEPYRHKFDDWTWMCRLCAGTDAGNAAQYPQANPPGVNAMLRTVCYVGNAIMEELRKRQ